MKIELKSIHHSKQFSQETEAFHAKLYINDKYVGYAENRGHGGNTDYYSIDKNADKLIREAEEYCKGLPPIEYPADEYMGAFKVDMNLEQYIDQLLYKFLEQRDLDRFNRKMEKQFLNSLVYGIPNKEYTTVKFKLPLEHSFTNERLGQQLSDYIRTKLSVKLKDGVVLLNTNVPESILKNAGLKEDQYVTPQVKEPGRQNDRTNSGRSR